MAEQPSLSDCWTSYDSVADAYESLAVPGFLPIAQDLVRAIDPKPGERILDLGTGTGLVAGIVAAAVGPSGTVVGVDPSVKILGRASKQRPVCLVAGKSPELPLVSGCFDAVVANLVLSHLPDLNHGLADAVRLLRTGGRLGVTAWAPDVTDAPGDDGPEADRIVAEIKSACGLDVPPPERGAAPHEEWLRERDNLAAVLSEAGLWDVQFDRCCYHRNTPVDDFVWGWGSQGRYLRHVVGLERWDDFTRLAAAALRERLGDTVNIISEVWIVEAQKP